MAQTAFQRSSTLKRWLSASLLLVAGLQPLAASAQATLAVPASAAGLFSTYQLGAGDMLTIRVLGEPELTLEKIRLTDAGTLSYPVLGEIRLLGLTVGELEKLIADGLRGRYLINPQVSVQMDEYRPFYVNGLVEKPGSYPYQPALTVRKAASIAGGLKIRASLDKIYVIRANDPRQEAIKADMNTPIYPGDTVVVEQSFF
ncbi:MAG: polysaccharide biosynthesis/export family protein [Vogesella sp.]|uniref:polysaccharide biosynthesis/export family protein n=1 Tax=Vogesella sp. TaxID=1904252 RepID=UPI00391BC791